MSYCLNPGCQSPENPNSVTQCQSCGSPLRKLRDRYRITQALAQGGFGATFLAQDDSLPGQPWCVIKQLRPSVNTPDVLSMARELFAREAQTLGKIGNHPQVPRLLDYFQTEREFYLVQEFVNGLTLQQEIKRKGVMGEAGVKQFLSEILGILKYIHSQQVIHRDIKPNNLIRRSEDGRLVLIDFGAVKNQVSKTYSNQIENTTLTAFSVGTNGFAPPEQIAMRPVYASDIYAVGITCIFLLTGKSPKDFDYHPSTGEMLWEQEVRISQHLTTVLRKMVEASVRHRYQSADEVLKALEMEPYFDSIASGMATQVRPRPTSTPSSQPSQPSQQQVYSGLNSHQQYVAALAQNIRARRELMATSDLNAQMTRQQPAVATKTHSPTKFKTKEVERLDSGSLITAYINGRRDFTSQNLIAIDLRRRNLSGIKCYASRLDKANLQEAVLCNGDFGQANLSQANLRNAVLTKAYMSYTDLSGADLRGADLSGAYLSNANLRGANLCGANLTGATLSDDQLALAKTDWFTKKPNRRG
jgi:serine/threonine-protein kinase